MICVKAIKILRERVEHPDAYPFSVPAIRSLGELNLRSRVCLFAGENGTGKSTLLEAIAAHYGFGREGGNRNFGNDSTRAITRLLRLYERCGCLSTRTGTGYFLRAESFFNTVSYSMRSPRLRLQSASITVVAASTRDLMAKLFYPARSQISTKWIISAGRAASCAFAATPVEFSGADP